MGCSGGQVQRCAQRRNLFLTKRSLQAVEGDDAEPPARGQAVENRIQALVQGVQFGVDRNADGLESAARRVLSLAALSRGTAAATISANCMVVVMGRVSRAAMILPAICQA